MRTRNPDNGKLTPTDFGSTAEEEKHTEVRSLKGRERAESESWEQTQIITQTAFENTHTHQHMHVD